MKVTELRYQDSFLQFLPAINVDVSCHKDSISIDYQLHTSAVTGSVLLLQFATSFDSSKFHHLLSDTKY